MEIPIKHSEKIAFNTGPEIEGHNLIVLDKSTHEENLSQNLQAKSKFDY